MTRYTRHEDEVPLEIVQGHDKDREGDGTTVVFDWAPGCEPSGLSGPPENYDPGEPDEFVIVSPAGLTPEREETVVNWLYEHWERPVEDDDPDWLRDQQRDDELAKEARL